MRAIEEKDDLMSIVSAANQELTQLQGALGSPVHSLGSPEKAGKAPTEKKSGLSEPQAKEEKKPPQQNQQQPPPTPQQPSQGPPMAPGGEPGTMPPPAGPPGMAAPPM